MGGARRAEEGAWWEGHRRDAYVMARESNRTSKLDRLLLSEISRINDDFRAIEKEEAPLGMVGDQNSVEEGVIPAAAGERPECVRDPPTRDGGGRRHRGKPSIPVPAVCLPVG
jgi:hypothetical protein